MTTSPNTRLPVAPGVAALGVVPAARAVALVVVLAGTAPVSAQDAGSVGAQAGGSGSPEPVRSLGQPPRWTPAAGMAFGAGRSEGGTALETTMSLALQRSFLNPVTGVLGVSAHGYVGQRGGELDGGLRAFLDSPAFYVHAGVDWNPRRGRLAPVVSTTFPPRRGGVFRRGGLVRVDVLGGREPGIAAGIWMPVGSRHSGRTRPGRVTVRMPDRPVRNWDPDPAPRNPAVRDLVEELDLSMRWIGALHNIYWQTERSGINREERVLRSRQILGFLRAELAEREVLMPERATYAREVEHYHATLERAMAEAAGGSGLAIEARESRLASAARSVVLEEVVLPYNATVGRFREPDTLDGLAPAALARFASWLDAEEELDAVAREEVVGVVRSWLQSLEREREDLEGWTGDGRMQWIPLAFVLRAEDHDTGPKIDALVERALRRPFLEGNRIQLLGAAQFQEELRRTLYETHTYHVLWIHDIRGRNELGEPDRTGYAQVADGYLRALLGHVRAFDRTGRLPAYVVLLDQYFYEENDGRLWMSLLERPLTHRVRLPAGFEHMEARLGALQDSLRMAVAASRRLDAIAAAHGSRRVEDLVKVHVNITNPADASFRTHRLLDVPLGGDNLLRDHRKLIIRDVTDRDPGAGEVILTGAGVGDHYASATWDDRAILIQGPAALVARDEARLVLERNGLQPHEIPWFLRGSGDGFDASAALPAFAGRAEGARVMQVHNRTGWGRKDATFIQMLLWDLLPAGTVLYVPDSLWTSPEWMAQLVSAALRGCRVLLVAPALANAPSAGFPQMSETRELLVALLVVREVLGDAIREAGGDLQVGVYARRAAMDDLPARIEELEAAFEAHPFLHRIFPLHPEAWRTLERHRLDPRDAEPRPPLLADDIAERRPLLHQKTQFFASGDLLGALGQDPAVAGAIDAYVERERLAGSAAWRGMPDPTGVLLPIAASLPPSLAEDAPAFLMVGSLNKNVRSMALDGEVMAVVSGPWALEGYVDFLFLSGAVAWLEAPEELDPYLPPYSDFKRLLGRFLLRIL